MVRLLREPLLHFFILALALFWVYGVLSPDTGSDRGKVVTVDRDAMLEFLQYRNRNFDREKYEARLDQMSADDLQRLTNEYVREEILYREAKAAELDRNDYVARRRLVQQFEYLTRSSIARAPKLSESDLDAYYRANKAEYYVKPKVTFTHVFISRRDRSDEESKRIAMGLGGMLEKREVGFMESAAYGERFPYHVNYVKKSRTELTGHFGEEMSEKLMALEPKLNVWQGPFSSPHGHHWVLLKRRTEGYQPLLEDIRQRVASDAYQAELQARREEAIEKVINKYRIVQKLKSSEPIGG